MNTLNQLYDQQEYEHWKKQKEKEKIVILDENGKVLPFNVAQYITQEHYIITFEDTEEIFIYNEGYYQKGGEKHLHKFLQNLLKDKLSNHIVNEILGHVKRSTYHSRESATEPKDKICLANGVLDINTLTVEPHSPNMVFLNRLPFAYNKNANCPCIKKFLFEVVREEDLLVLQEFAGYCLWKKYHIQKMFLLIGGGSNGKSTFLSLLRSFLGPENCAAIPLQHMTMDRFSVAHLFGKLVNIFADLSAKALNETSILKMLTGDDLIPAQKKFKDAFFFINHAKQIFSCNKVPRSPDDTDAFFRRWVMINFPYQFLGKKADKDLIKKLTTPEELSGFFNFALEGLKRLLENGDFSLNKAVEEVREQYIRESDSVAAFVMDCIELQSNGYIPKKKLYTHYADYCRERNYPAVAENAFHRELQFKIRVDDYRPAAREGTRDRTPCWKGITIKPEAINLLIKLGKSLTSLTTLTENEKNVNHVNDVNPFSHLRSKSEKETIQTNNTSPKLCFRCNLPFEEDSELCYGCNQEK